VGALQGQTNLNVGPTTPLTLAFSGGVILAGGQNGPYNVAALVLSDPISGTVLLFADSLGQTASYQASQFSDACSSITSLTVSPNSPSTYGQAVTLTATVSPTNATGSVVFKDGATTLNSSPTAIVNGVATFTTSSLSIGSHTLSASYNGDSSYSSSTSSNTTYTVQGATGSITTTTSLKVNPISNSDYGQAVTLTAKISPTNATGMVDFLDKGTKLNSSPVTLVNGVAIFATSTLITGSHTLSAIYSGDSSYFGSTSNNVTYKVYGVEVVKSHDDDGKGEKEGTFSYVLKHHVSGTPLTIIFNTNIISFTGSLTIHIPSGVRLDGGSTYNPSTGPAVIIIGSGAIDEDGLVFDGDNTVRNIWIKGFGKRQIVVSALSPYWKGKLTLQWVKVSRS
jgi:hypothetical protein